MNFNDPIVMQYASGSACTLLGLCGWILPWRWNVLRLHRGLARLVPEKVERLIPKIVGTALIICGLGVIIATACVGKLD